MSAHKRPCLQQERRGKRRKLPGPQTATSRLRSWKLRAAKSGASLRKSVPIAQCSYLLLLHGLVHASMIVGCRFNRYRAVHGASRSATSPCPSTKSHSWPARLPNLFLLTFIEYLCCLLSTALILSYSAILAVCKAAVSHKL